MSRDIYQDLLARQTKVTIILGYIIVGVFSIAYLVLKFQYEFKHPLLTIMSVFILLNLLNLIVSRYHGKIYLTYQLLIIWSYLFLLSISFFTGGLISPVIFILAILPVAAFSTSKKQGTSWSFLCVLTICIFLAAHNYNLIPKSIISESHQITFSFISILFYVLLSVIMSFLINKSSFAAHRKSDRESKALKEKTMRLENLTTLLNYSNDLMCIIDQDSLAIDDLNPVYKVHLGYELSEVRKSDFFKYIKEDGATNSILENLKSLKDDTIYEFSCIMLGKGGEERQFNWVAIAKNRKVHASAKIESVK